MDVRRPAPELTEDGRRIVYPIWRADMAEAIIESVKKKLDKSQKEE